MSTRNETVDFQNDFESIWRVCSIPYAIGPMGTPLDSFNMFGKTLKFL